jgi:hypothetical protein
VSFGHPSVLPTDHPLRRTQESCIRS